MLKKIISFILSWTLITSQSIFAQGVAQINLGNYIRAAGSSVAMDKFRPLHMRYFSYNIGTDNFQLLLDKGDNKDIKEGELEEKTKALMDYFKIGLSLPNEKFWVNLRPDAQDQIIDPELEKTDIGKIMLEADLQLKKDTSGMTSPQTSEGKLYWDKLYKKARELFGTENITIPTITRPWIVPGEIILRQGEDSAYIFKANMKVMLEHDYLSSQPSAISSQQYNFKDPRMKELNEYSSQLIRELIIPKLTKEVNTSKRYAALRQVFFSLVMARWFKDTFGSSGSASAPGTRAPENSYIKLIDSGDLTNLTSKESWSKTYYFNEYKKSFEKGEYNLKEDIYTPTGQVIRSYVSGGIVYSFVTSGFKGFKKSLIPIFLSLVSLFSGFSGNPTGELTSVAAAEVIIKDKAPENLADLVRSSELLLNKLEAEAVSAEEKEKIKKMKEGFEMAVKSGSANEAFLIEMNKILTLTNMLMQQKKFNALHYETLEQLNKNFAAITQLDKRQAEIIKRIRETPFTLQKHREMLEAAEVIIAEVGEENAVELAKILQEAISAAKNDPDANISFVGKAEGNKLLQESLDKIQKILPKPEDLPPKYLPVQNLEKIYGLLYRAHKNIPKPGKSSSSLTKFQVELTLVEAFLQEEIGAPTMGEVDEFFEIIDGNFGENFVVSEAKSFAYSIAGKLLLHAGKVAKLKGVPEEKIFSVMLTLRGRSDSEGIPPLDDIIKEVKGTFSAVGGIDFRTMNYMVQPMGSFKDLQFGLPTLTSSALERINLDKELESLRGLVKVGMVPSGMRVKEYLAACFQKGKIEEKQDDLLVCLAEIYRLAEEENLETSPELRESLVIVDTGKFVFLPNNQKAGLN